MKKALVAIDQSQNSQFLISYAFRFAEKNSIERLDFIHVVTRIDLSISGYVDYPPHYNEESIRQSFLNMIEKGMRESGVTATPFEFVLSTGTPYEEIIKMAEKNRYELILIGHRGLSNLERFFIGSVAAKVVRHAPCTVLVHLPRETEEAAQT